MKVDGGRSVSIMLRGVVTAVVSTDATSTGAIGNRNFAAVRRDFVHHPLVPCQWTGALGQKVVLQFADGVEDPDAALANTREAVPMGVVAAHALVNGSKWPQD